MEQSGRSAGRARPSPSGTDDPGARSSRPRVAEVDRSSRSGGIEPGGGARRPDAADPGVRAARPRPVDAAARSSWATLVVACVVLTALVLVAGLAALPASVAAGNGLLGLGAAALLASAGAFLVWARVWSGRGLPAAEARVRVLSGVTAATATAWLPVLLALALHAA